MGRGADRMTERGTPQEVASAAATSVEALSRRYQAGLVRYFTRRGLAFSDAQDLAQEVFARLARPGTLNQLPPVAASVAGNTVVTQTTPRPPGAARVEAFQG